jgi:tetratricopeptide (TPR) repeat protein
MGRRDAALPVMVWTEAPGCETLGFHKNSLAKALADYTQAIELKPDFAEAWWDRAQAYLDLHQYDKAVADYSKAIELDPTHATLWNSRGLAYQRLHQYDKALADYSKAIELDPKNVAAWNNRGYAYEELHQYDKAITALNEAIELDPKEAHAWNNRGYAYNLLHQYDKALADYSKAIELDPKYAVAWDNRAHGYAALTQWDKASSDFSKAVELNPDDHRARCLLALARLGAGDRSGYRHACAALLDRFGQAELPNQALWYLVLAPDAVNDRNRLVHKAEAALRKDPQTGWASTILGATLYRADRFAEAIQRLNEANTAWEQAGTKPAMYSPAYLWFFLAMTHQRQGDALEARRWLTKAQKWMEQETQDSRNPAWNRRLTLQLLRREAEQLLAAPATDPGAPAKGEKPRAKAPAR